MLFTRLTRTAARILVLTLVVGWSRNLAAAEKDERIAVLDALETELKRNMNGVAPKGAAKPYFMLYRYAAVEQIHLDSKYGALRHYEMSHPTSLPFIEVRLGSYDSDNTPINSEGIGSYPPEWGYGPAETNIDAIRTMFWLGTDRVYKMAVAYHANKQAELARRVPDSEPVADFTKEKPSKFVEAAHPLTVDGQAWAKLINSTSALFSKYAWIHDSTVTIWGKRETVYIVNSEGTKVIKEPHQYYFGIEAVAYNPKGQIEYHRYALSTSKPEDLPNEQDCAKLVEQVTSELSGLLKAEVQPPFTGPAILWPEATGVFFHEALGHRLEGDRFRVETEGDTFKDKIGQEIIPKFISVVDDPTMKKLGDKTLFASYDYDDEGIPAQRVQLVKDGVLKNYLMSRRPVKGFAHSNGHGRSDGFKQPMARMSNLIVESSTKIPYEELKKQLIEECKKQNKPYGLIVKGIAGGETNTEDWTFQAFNVEPTLLYQLDAKTGEEKLVRGASIVGTPLTSIQNIKACGDMSGVFNGFCGALSGQIPQTNAAPAVLTSTLEVQKVSYSPDRPPNVPPPFKKDK